MEGSRATQPQSRAHIPVLLREVLELLAPQPGDVVLDCTAGLGGHAEALARRVGPRGTLILFDLDPGNLAAAAGRVRALHDAPGVLTFNASFADAPRLLRAGLAPSPDTGAQARPIPPVNVLLADLGFASNQIDTPERGFSFSRNGPLDMRLNPAAPITASELVNTMPERELAELIRDLAEEPWPAASAIARKLVQARAAGPISTTAELAAIIRSALPPRRHGSPSIDPATRTFQALRIAVNDELGSLASLLEGIRRSAAMLVSSSGGSGTLAPPGWLAPGARIGIISFHSLEDRPVKQAFSNLVQHGLAADLTRRPAVATDDEIAANPRSRSAKFRAVRIAGGA